MNARKESILGQRSHESTTVCRPARFAVIAVLSFLGLVRPLQAQQCDPQIAHTYSGFFDNELVGFSAAMHGDTAAVGIPGITISGNQAAGYVAVRIRTGATTWAGQGFLIPSDSSVFQQFGYNVAVEGDTIAAVGASAPAVYVFTRSGTMWTQQQKIVPTAGTEPNGGFAALAISGNTIVAGAPVDTLNDDVAGAVFVFVFNGSTWTQQAKLRPADTFPFSFQQMGTSVAIDGDTIVAGAPQGVAGRGAYAFTRSGTTWSQQAKIQPDDLDAQPGFGDGFGSAVDLEGDRIVVGAPEDQEGAPWSGAAYFYSRSGSTWSQDQKFLTPPTTVTFGTSVSLSGERCVVGAYRYTAPISNTGKVHILVRENGIWTLRATITTPSGETNDAFGAAVDFDRNFVVVGSPYRYSNNKGAAYIYELGCNGACCIDASTCSVMELGLCAAASGNFRGVGSNCIGMSCAPACCPGDVNGDDEINGLDAQALVDALMQGVTCP
jgi:hypothetical protein